jgi:DNA-binding SARP family transcriptional activator
MRAYYMAGDRTMALRQYERCAAALAEELGVAPSTQTLMLYEQRKTDSGVEEPGTALKETSPAPLPEVLN